MVCNHVYIMGLTYVSSHTSPLILLHAAHYTNLRQKDRRHHQTVRGVQHNIWVSCRIVCDWGHLCTSLSVTESCPSVLASVEPENDIARKVPGISMSLARISI